MKEASGRIIMKRRTKKFLGVIAVGAGAIGAVGAVFMRKKTGSGAGRSRDLNGQNQWARPGMLVTFRAELKPGLGSADRTFKVAEVLVNGRVLLEGVSGEHTETEFEKLRFE